MYVDHAVYMPLQSLQQVESSIVFNSMAGNWSACGGGTRVGLRLKAEESCVCIFWAVCVDYEKRRLDASLMYVWDGDSHVYSQLEQSLERVSGYLGKPLAKALQVAVAADEIGNRLEEMQGLIVC